MNLTRLSGAILLLALLCACTATQQENVQPASDFSGQLTGAETSGGKLTPEILWKFGRLGDVRLSPDGSKILYDVTRYDAGTNGRATDIYLKSVGGGEPVGETAAQC